MGGIAGVMTADGSPPQGQVLDMLAAALAHRGPEGLRRHVNGGVGLVERQAPAAGPPDGASALAANGAAVVADARIHYAASTEAAAPQPDADGWGHGLSPLQGYLRDGEAVPGGVDGMYALAAYFPTDECLVLARDPFGIKPLYYVEGRQGFAFASQPSALIRAGFAAPQVAEEPRDELLQLQFTTGRETIYAGVCRVLPGERLVVASGRVVERARRPALPPGGPVACSEAEALDRLERALSDSVLARLAPGQPSALFLSGGIESAVLLALLKRLGVDRLLTFTAGVEGAGPADERAEARRLAELVGAEHTEVAVDESDFWSLLPEIAAAVDDPAADYAVLLTYLLARTAARQVRTVLTGDGGDELFAGRGRYRTAVRPWYLGGPRALLPHGRFDRLGVLRREPTAWRDGIRAAESLLNTPDRTRLQQVQAADCAAWLPNDLLLKLDRCLGAHGLEALTPFLDGRLAEFAFRLPDDLKIRRGSGKYLLRRWLERALPAVGPYSRKRGATVPIGDWLKKRGADLGPLVAAQPGIEEIARPARVQALFRSGGKRESFAAWSLLFYALWHRRHILGLVPAGDVFETLWAKP